MWSILRQNFIRASENGCDIVKFTKRFAGHSKWANIKHIKAVKDGERATLFAKFARQMRLAITEGGSHKPADNLKLSQIIEQAKKKSMPVATINGIIDKASKSANKLQIARLDVRGPGGCIIIVELHTDNLKGLKMILQNTFKKFKCTYVDQSSRHVFSHKGFVITDCVGTLDSATEDAIVVGAEDVEEIDEDGEKRFRFTCEPMELPKVVNQLGNMKYNIISSDEEFIPLVYANLSDEDIDKAAALYVKLEAHEEVTRLHDNIA